MKKQLFLLIISSLLVAETSGQYWYSKYYGNKELSELNSEELLFLNQKSQTTARAGSIMTIAGAATGVISLSVIYFSAMADLMTWEYSGDAKYDAAFAVCLLGTGMYVIGIPTWIIGAHRRKTISDVIDSQEPGALLQITPSFQYDHFMHGYSSGLTFSITF
jgi:hypothetical protein